MDVDPRLTFLEVCLIIGQAAWIPIVCFLIAGIVVAVTSDKNK